MTLQGMRRSVDRLDGELLRLLAARLEYAIRTRRFKEEVQDQGREEEVLGRVKQMSNSLLSEQFVDEIFRLLMGESRRLQAENPRLAAFHGDHGSYSEVALLGFNESLLRIPCHEYSDVFEAVANGSVDFGIVPIENSIEGSVDQTLDALMETELEVVAELRIPIRHCLLTVKGSDHREIKEVFSHPDALAHCRGFLKRNKLEARPYYDSAGAAAMIARERPNATAVIASELCARLYDLDILKSGIGDHETNSTRYFVLARAGTSYAGAENEEKTKCSLVFTLTDRAGSLLEVLKIFSEGGINLTKIESRPNRKSPNEVGFLLDFEGRKSDPLVQGILDRLSKSVKTIRVLGWY